MELDKIRNLGDAELAVEEHKAGEQLFRLRFQLKLGQTDGVKKLRLLKKDIARIQTIKRERELGLHGAERKTESSAPTKAAKKAPKAVPKKTAAKKVEKTTKKEAR